MNQNISLYSTIMHGLQDNTEQITYKYNTDHTIYQNINRNFF